MDSTSLSNWSTYIHTHAHTRTHTHTHTQWKEARVMRYTTNGLSTAGHILNLLLSIHLAYAGCLQSNTDYKCLLCTYVSVADCSCDMAWRTVSMKYCTAMQLLPWMTQLSTQAHAQTGTCACMRAHAYTCTHQLFARCCVSVLVRDRTDVGLGASQHAVSCTQRRTSWFSLSIDSVSQHLISSLSFVARSFF